MHYVTENVQSNTASIKRLQAALATQRLTAKYTLAGDWIDFSDKTEISTVWPTGDWMETLKLQGGKNLGAEGSSLDVNGFVLFSCLLLVISELF